MSKIIKSNSVNRNTVNSKTIKKSNLKYFLLGIGLIVATIVVIVLIKGNSKGTEATNSVSNNNNVVIGENLTLVKSEITETPKFYPYKSGNTDMEVIALKATDKTIRTVFNTCQVCTGSGKGYYKVEGDSLVCQNCGNKFKFDQVAIEKGGCNPVPILDENKTVDDTNIVISKEFLQQSTDLFKNWKS